MSDAKKAKQARDVTAVSYACMILRDEGAPVTEDRIRTILKAANVKIDVYWIGIYLDLFKKYPLTELFKMASGGGIPVAAAPVAEVEEEEPEADAESEEESDDEDGGLGMMAGGGLFGDDDSEEEEESSEESDY